MNTGTVKWFQRSKGATASFSRMRAARTFSSTFLRSSARMRGLAEGQKISYEIQDDRRTGNLRSKSPGCLTVDPLALRRARLRKRCKPSLNERRLLPRMARSYGCRKKS